MWNGSRHHYSIRHFQETTGYVVRNPQKLMAFGHTASIAPWSDPQVHLHTHSEEYFFLQKGELRFSIDDFALTLQPNEILMVYPDVPHAIVGGTGRIEHFGIRTPDLDDKQIVGELKQDLPFPYESQRLISEKWGHRIPLHLPQHKNCRLIGGGSALYKSQHFIMAYLDFPTQAEANAGLGTRPQLHFHQKSWEYHVVLQGEKDILLVEDERVFIRPGDILEVPPNVRHTWHRRAAPSLGFTIRVPMELDDKVILDRGKE